MLFPSYLWQSFKLDLRKLFAYRGAFWSQFFIRSVVVLMVNIFLWRSIYSNPNANYGGFSLNQILLYALFAVATGPLLEPSEGSISQQIFDGTFTRYLIYPGSFFGFRITNLIAELCLGLLQFAICLGLGSIMIPALREVSLFSNPLDLVRGLLASFAAAYLQAMMVLCLEFAAFWVDQVWNLMAMNRFTGSLLGGLMIPLTFFPESMQKIFAALPYASIFQFPLLSLMGRIRDGEWFANFGICLFWCIFFHLLATFVMHRGLRKYSGVGQ